MECIGVSNRKIIEYTAGAYMKSKIQFNANYLKVVAIIAMTIDHCTDLFYPGFPTEPIPLGLHFIGRLTAPIMWFFCL